MNFTILHQITPGTILKKVQETDPEKTIDKIRRSGLKGRGGAGFPSGLKWELTKKSLGEKIIVCNADEGELGTFKDLKLLQEYAKNVLEGMCIAAYTLKSKKGFIYLRWEYSFIKDHLQKTIDLYSQILPSFDIELRIGRGAYVCGEETALIDSLEGKRGESRNKPPYPVNNGYMNLPTLVHNVETLCCITSIIDQGIELFDTVGTDHSKGTKLFSISGDVANPGVYEYPLGTPLKELLNIANATKTKAVIVGGAGGEIVDRTEFDRLLAFEDLSTGGSIIVINNSRKIIEVLEKLADFFVEESCGQCVPCREGTYVLLNFIKKIKKGSVSNKELETHHNLAETIQLASKCGLGQSAPNIFSKAIKMFRDEIFSKKKGGSEND